MLSAIIASFAADDIFDTPLDSDADADYFLS